LKETATTTVFVTHDLPEAAQLAGRMAVIIANRLRQVGDPERVFAAPADEDVAGFVNHRAKPG
jgi:ABC-type sugar transport system ATPase subunit